VDRPGRSLLYHPSLPPGPIMGGGVVRLDGRSWRSCVAGRDTASEGLGCRLGHVTATTQSMAPIGLVGQCCGDGFGARSSAAGGSCGGGSDSGGTRPIMGQPRTCHGKAGVAQGEPVARSGMAGPRAQWREGRGEGAIHRRPMMGAYGPPQRTAQSRETVPHAAETGFRESDGKTSRWSAARA
jgi:hypothetical protein